MFGFNKNFVKIKNEDWEDIKTDYNQLVQDNKQLRAQVQAGASDEIQQLKDIIAKQSESLKQMAKWKDNDDLLYSYEQSNKTDKQTIKQLETKVAILEEANEKITNAYKTEKAISDSLIEKLTQYTNCEDYRTVSKFDITA